MTDKSVVVMSGGMDSTTTLYIALAESDASDIVALSFDYGQRHRKELIAAAQICKNASVEHHVIDLTSLTSLIATSALTDPEHEVPEGHYADENMKQTVVPNRNSIMANVSIGVAISRHARYLYLGVHAGDHAIYPDCRPEFVDSLQHLAEVANKGFIEPYFEIRTPFIYKTKADIVAIGLELGVPYGDTWTCYKGGEVHCGRCATCVERLEAFDAVGAIDPVMYEVRDAWQEFVQ